MLRSATPLFAGEPSSLSTGGQQFDGDVPEAASSRRASDRREPLGGDAVQVDPAPDVLHRQVQVARQGSERPTLNDRAKPHVRFGTRVVLAVNMTDAIEPALVSGMTDEPKDRLRLARSAAHLSVEELAERTGQAASTVRAHENGQNAIRPRAAQRYAEALLLDPSWIMFGAGTGPRASQELETVLHQVQILGEVRHGAWYDKSSLLRLRDDYQAILLPEYKDYELHAFEMGDTYGVYPQGALVYVVDLDVATPKPGDEVVVVRFRAGLSEIGIWEVVGRGSEQRLARFDLAGRPSEKLSWEEVMTPAETQEARATGTEPTDDNIGVVQGVVVACQWSRSVLTHKPSAK